MSDTEIPEGAGPDRRVGEPHGRREGLHDAETEEDTASGGPADPPGDQHEDDENAEP